MRILLAWSGGLDSTYSLFRYLDEGHEVHAHHIIIKSNQYRWEFEKEAVDKIRSLIKSDKFFYNESEVDLLNFSWAARDMLTVGFMMGHAMNDIGVRTHKPVDVWTTGAHYHTGRSDRIKRAIKMAELVCHDAPVPPHYDPVDGIPVTKDEEREYLEKKGVLKYVWSCRTPLLGKECGGCETCLGKN